MKVISRNFCALFTRTTLELSSKQILPLILWVWIFSISSPQHESWPSINTWCRQVFQAFCSVCMCAYIQVFIKFGNQGAENSMLRKIDCSHHVNSLYMLGPKSNAWSTFLGSLSCIIGKHYRLTLGFTWGTWIKINMDA